MSPLPVSALAGGDVPPELVAIGVPVVSSDDGPRPLPAAWRPEGAGEAPGVLPAPLEIGRAWAEQQGFGAEPGRAAVWRSLPGEPRVVLLGLGDRPGDVDRWRKAAAALVRTAGRGGTALLVLPEAAPAASLSPEDVAAAVTEGAVLAAYRFDELRSEPSPATVDRLLLARGGDPAPVEEGIGRGARAAEATTFARDLVNRPAGRLTPTILAEVVEDRFRGIDGVSVEAWGEHRIEDERMGGLLGVNRGSTEPPRFLRITYRPPDDEDRRSATRRPRVALVGKGITFDSGGLSLKTAEGMTTMKTDMGGAAAVLGALWAAARERLPVEVTAYAPLTENMPGGSATKPGDVLTIRNGATIEVLNTDAEGRLVLADALSLAVEDQPDLIVDVATLTGAAVVALGRSMAALFASDDALADRVTAAGTRAGEPNWRLPLPEQYRSHIDSDVADMKNIGRAGEAGSIAAALLLARFVGEVPWAHLDIAGPARSSEVAGYLAKGGTGFGVRTLLELVRDVAARGL